ncbi:MAG TPA: hypothetical protein VF552_09435 [Allosphingosinicella sp.]|jgi:hypothetical protein
MKRIVLAAMAAAAALGASVPAAFAAAQAQAPRVTEGADPAIWQGEATSGTIVHRESGISLPESYGNFRRTRVGAISAADVFANYVHRRGEHETTVTVYLFRPGSLPEHRLPMAVEAIGVRSPQAFLWSDGPFLIGSTPELRAYKATFKTGIGPNTIMDYLYFVPLGRWTVKVRATLPSTTDIANEREIDALVRALPWPAVLNAAGTCTGWACETASAAPFNSHMAEGAGIGNMLITRGGAPAATYTQGNYRLTELVLPELSRLFTDSYGAISVGSPIYAVETGRAEQRRIHRFFAGRPTEEQFRQAVSLLRDHPEGGPMTPPAIAARHAPHRE